MLSNKKIADASKQELTLLAKARAHTTKYKLGLERGLVKQEQDSKDSGNRKTRLQIG